MLFAGWVTLKTRKKTKEEQQKRRTDKATEKEEEEEEDKEDKKEEENTRVCDKTHIFSSLYISRFIPLFFAVGVVVYNNITEERARLKRVFREREGKK
jgi:hypothetical protein